MKFSFRAFCESYSLVSNRQRFEDFCLIMMGIIERYSNCSQPKDKSWNYQITMTTQKHVLNVTTVSQSGIHHCELAAPPLSVGTLHIN